jgi:hypothetical protein
MNHALLLFVLKIEWREGKGVKYEYKNKTGRKLSLHLASETNKQDDKE